MVTNAREEEEVTFSVANMLSHRLVIPQDKVLLMRSNH